jgi:putative tryptophan/tyrosine transport system substrate-binding protein
VWGPAQNRFHLPREECPRFSVWHPPALAAKNATSTIPIFAGVGDPVRIGLVVSLARPGGNLTGMVFMTSEMMPKRLEVLSELVPQAGVIALLVNPNNSIPEPSIQNLQDAARTKGFSSIFLRRQ